MPIEIPVYLKATFLHTDATDTDVFDAQPIVLDHLGFVPGSLVRTERLDFFKNQVAGQIVPQA